jgi:hypothetical protein
VTSVDQLSSICSSMEKLFFSPVCCSQSLFSFSVSVLLDLVLPILAFPGPSGSCFTDLSVSRLFFSVASQ